MHTLERKISLGKTETGHCGSFSAMASPCQLLLASDDEELARELTTVVANEAWRVEQTYSRYSTTNCIHRINQSNGKAIEVDRELAELLSFADSCYRLSNGLFDITSGVLREIWTFDGSDRVPSRKQAKALLDKIGWNKVTWAPPVIELPQGMQIDLGGICKEYAVDSAANLLAQRTHLPYLINFGGDLYVNKPPSESRWWNVGIDKANHNSDHELVRVKSGGVATSGDANRFLLRDGVRYSHVLNPRTGWPVSNAPSSVTVIDDSCVQAGFIATLAMLHGRQATQFLTAQDVEFWLCL